MKDYNPNIDYGIHTIEITLQQWGYVGHIRQEISGNCKGRNVIDFEFYCIDDCCVNDCNLKYDEDYRYYFAVLTDSEGNTLEVEGDADDFNNMIVKVEIIDFQPDRRIQKGDESN